MFSYNYNLCYNIIKLEKLTDNFYDRFVEPSQHITDSICKRIDEIDELIEFIETDLAENPDNARELEYFDNNWIEDRQYSYDKVMKLLDELDKNHGIYGVELLKIRRIYESLKNVKLSRY